MKQISGQGARFRIASLAVGRRAIFRAFRDFSARARRRPTAVEIRGGVSA